MKNLFLRLMTIFTILLGTTNLMATTKVDIIFVMDTSGSMNDEAEALVKAINDVVSDLSSEFDIDAKLWGITNNYFNGLTSYVTANVTNPISNHVEDWGPAVNDLASKYNRWRNGAIKIIVPVSDECPENGDGCYQDDEIAVTDARAAADANGVNVLPIIGSPYDPSLYDKIKQLASSLSTVDGKIITTSSSVYAAEMKEVIKDIIASVTGDIVRKPVLGDYYIMRNLINIPIISAPGAINIEWKAIENNTTVFEGISGTNKISIYIPIINIATHEYVVKARSIGKNSSGETIYSDWVETTVKYNYYYNNIEDLIKEKLTTENPATLEVKLEEEIAQVSDPVDITTGNFYLLKTDIFIKTAGIPFILTRQYNSLDIKRGWSFNIVSRMDATDINNIKVYWGNGVIESFIKSEKGWFSKYGTSVLYTESGFYTVETSDKTKFKFTFDGRLSQVVDEKGLGYKYEYMGNNIIIKDSFDNHLLTIYRDKDGKIISTKDNTGNTTTYAYDGSNIVSYTDRNGNTTYYEYNANGILYKIIGPDGNAYVENSYDAKGRVISQLDGAGNKTEFAYDVDENTYIINKTTVTYPDGSIQEFNNYYDRVSSVLLSDGSNIAYEYDANGKISKIIDQNGKSWSFKRNEKGILTEYKDPLGNGYKYSYDENNNIIEIENPIGQKVNFEYDSNQNLIKITYPDNSTELFKYNSNNQLIELTNQVGNTVSYEYNNRGFVSKIILPNLGEIKYSYNSLGQIISVEDPLGNKVTYTYDKEGRITSETDALGNITSYKYNEYGDLVEIINANGKKTLIDYNIDGLKTKVTLPDSSTFKYRYDALGRLIETEDKLGRVSKIEYDSLGRVARIITPSGRFVDYKYDAVGNLVKIIDQEGNEFKNEYNDIGQLTKKYDALGNILIEKEYNALGLPILIKDGIGRNVKFQYDNLNRLTKSTLSDTISASAFYDKLGQITSIVDPKGNKTVYEYDAMGNLIKEITPLGKITKYSYDTNGRIKSIINPDQTEITYNYDAVGNIKILRFINGKNEYNITYNYDRLYNPISIKDSLGEIVYEYDALGRVIKRKDVFGNELLYNYDEIGRLKTITYPDGKVVTYEYNNDDQLIKIVFNGNVTTYEYNTLGKLVKVTYPNDFYTTYEYDKNHKLIKLQNFDANGKVLTANILTRNSVGDITNIDRTDLVTPDLSNIVSTNFTVNEDNQIVANGSDIFTYDENGNLINYKIGGENRSFTYNLRDKVSTATMGSDRFSYTYDAEGNRVAVTKNGITKRYVIDNVLGLQKPLAQTDTNNVIEKYFIYGNGLVYAINADGSLEVYLYDYKGSTTAIVDNNGKILNAYTYSAYGKVLGSIENIENSYKYLGKYGVITDSDAHLYIRARYYSPELGRFTQTDILKGNIKNPLSLNRYRYTDGNPIGFVDINGYLAMFLVDDNGALGLGHAAVAIQNRETGGWDLYSWGPDSRLHHTVIEKKFTGQKDYFRSIFGKFNKNSKSSNYNYERYDELFIIATTYEEEKLMKQYAESIKNSGEKYNLFNNNCMHVAVRIINEGLKKRKDYQLKINSIRPDKAIKGFVKQELKHTKRKKFIDDFYDPIIDKVSDEINEITNTIKNEAAIIKNKITNKINELLK